MTPLDARTRLPTKAEIDGLIDFVADIANTRLGGSHVFGGQYSDTAPFIDGEADPTRPPSGDLRMEIGAGEFVNTNHGAQEIFLDTDAFESPRARSDALGSNDTQAIGAALTCVDDSFTGVQEVVGELGARMGRLDQAISNIDSLEVTLQTYRSELGDAGLAKAVTDLVNRRNALEAAMLANSKILNVTLTDYLR